MTPGNLFQPFPGTTELEAELLEVLSRSGSALAGLRIERILSPPGHSSEAGHWYDQDTTEWILLLQGSATLKFKNPEETVDLSPGDYLEIQPHHQHRIERTHPAEPTLWLAIHWS